MSDEEAIWVFGDIRRQGLVQEVLPNDTFTNSIG